VQILGGLLFMVLSPLALVFGIVGIVCDQRKGLAIATTIIAAGCVLFILCVFGVAKIVCP